MKLWFMIVIMALFLIACSPKTEVFYPQKQQVITVQEPVPVKAVQQEVKPQPTQPVPRQQPTNSIEEESDVEEEPQREVEVGSEYNVVSCCAEGKLFAQATQKRSAYSKNNVKDMLVSIYASHCDQLKDQVTQRVYLRFLGDIQDSSYLTYFKSVNYKRIQVDYGDVEGTFEGCN
jgi:hypothetical protein